MYENKLSKEDLFSESNSVTTFLPETCKQFENKETLKQSTLKELKAVLTYCWSNHDSYLHHLLLGYHRNKCIKPYSYYSLFSKLLTH